VVRQNTVGVQQIMTGYAVMLRLVGKSCVVVGGGQVAARKVPPLLDAGAVVTIISPAVIPALAESIAQGWVTWLAQPYAADLLRVYHPALVFAATDTPALNARIAADARQMGVWVNAASDGAVSDFHNLTTFDHPPLSVSISTNGAAPALARHIQAHLSDSLRHFATLAGWLGALRPSARATLPQQTQRQQLYERIIDSEVLELLQAGDENAARSRFESLVREALS
jgi:siroheme synthase-like protein